MPFILTHYDKKTKIVNLLIILDDGEVERIKERDPCEIDPRKIATRHSPGARVGMIGIVWGSSDDIAEIVRLQKAGQHADALAYAVRGWSTRPDDHAETVSISRSRSETPS